MLSMLYKVTLNSNHCLFRDLPSASTGVRHLELRLQLIQWEFEVPRCSSSTFGRCFLPARFECGMTFPTLCLIPKPWIGSRVQSTVGYFSELIFFSIFHGAVACGVAKPTINNNVFPTWACTAGYNNNNVYLPGNETKRSQQTPGPNPGEVH